MRMDPNTPADDVESSEPARAAPTKKPEPTYMEAFPPLVAQPKSANFQTNIGQWNQKMAVRTTQVTQVFSVPLEERRYKEMEMGEQKFGMQSEQAKKCTDIMQRTGAVIEMSLNRDKSMTFVVTGRVDAVMKARRLIISQLQTQASITIPIPKEHHRFLLGKAGAKLTQLELETATKIQIPRQDEMSDAVRIIGTKEGIDKARHEIQLISDEQAKLAFERVPVSKIYHPFVCGPHNKNLHAIAEQTGAKINVPPPSVMKDEITVAGEKEGVLKAVKIINDIYDEKKRKCQTVSVEVPKSQHRYVIGQRANNLHEILEQTDVSVEMPPTDVSSDTITLRGEPAKLGVALTMVWDKANSVKVAEVAADAWLHKFIIGKGGSNIRQITEGLSSVHVEFKDDRIIIEGPPEQAEEAERVIIDNVTQLKSRITFEEIIVDQRFHRHVIGRAGANINRIKNDTGVQINVPSDNEKSNVIRIEGPREGVQRARHELMEMVVKMENEKSRDVFIEQRFHRTVIGTKGDKIKEIRDKFNQVNITFPEAGRKSDVVTIRGAKEDVDKCFKYLQALAKELVESNYQIQVPIFKQFHKNVIGKGGATIKKIREETDTKIDLPTENSNSDVILITGKKANAEAAREKIQAIQNELANIVTVDINIPANFHNSIIGVKGRYIDSIRDECNGVNIHFPAESLNSDKVQVRGPKDDVEKAKKLLLELATEKQIHSHMVEVKAKPEHHKFLIGKGGANIRKFREKFDVRVVFPNSKDEDLETICIVGKKESVEIAGEELRHMIKDLDNIVEGEISIDPRHHRHFIQRQFQVLHEIAAEYGGVVVSFPRGSQRNDLVRLKGSKDSVEGAKKRLVEIVTELENQVTIECVIAQKFHRKVMGAKGSKLQAVTQEHNVHVKFPEREVRHEGPEPRHEGPEPRHEGQEPRHEGQEPRHEGQEPSHEGQEPRHEGQEPRTRLEDGQGDTEVETLPNGDSPAQETPPEGAGDGGDEGKARKCDTIIITGQKENCEAAKEALLALVPVVIDVCVPYDFHRFIIGQKGQEVRRLMEEHDVNIAVPPANEKCEIIKVTGAPKNVESAKIGLAQRVEELEKDKEDRLARSFKLECKIDPKYHPKIIGRRGNVISKIREAHDVQIQFPERNHEDQELITIMGYEANAKEAKEDIMKIIQELEDMITEEVSIDHRIHSRLIGARGRAIRKIMDDYKVDIRFPRPGAEDPNLVSITGDEQGVLDAKDHLLNIEEEYLMDVNDAALLKQYTQAPSRHGDSPKPQQEDYVIVVEGAPWNRAPDTSSAEEFPSMGDSVAPSHSVAWGPSARSKHF